MARRRPGLRRLPPAVRRRVMLTLGATESRLLDWQAEAGAAFVRDTAGDLSLEQALSVYLRLVDVPDRHQDAVARGAMALLEANGDGHIVEGHAHDGLLGRIGRRLGGRRRDALRARIAGDAARARRRVRELYVEGAREVVAALDDLLPPVESVQLFVDALGIPPRWADVIFHDALSDAIERSA